MIISYEIFCKLYVEAKEQENLEMYQFERGGEDWMEGATGDEIMAFLKTVHKIARGGFPELLEQYKNMRVMSEHLGIPYSTLQKWKQGISRPAEHLLKLMEYATVNK